MWNNYVSLICYQFSRSLFANKTNKDEFKHVYNMTYPKRGMAVIINNRVFDRRTQMGERTGTDVDAANLYQVFKKLGFEVHMFNNQKTTDMLKILSAGMKLTSEVFIKFV